MSNATILVGMIGNAGEGSRGGRWIDRAGFVNRVVAWRPGHTLIWSWSCPNVVLVMLGL